jgi:hypothetical protein
LNSLRLSRSANFTLRQRTLEDMPLSDVDHSHFSVFMIAIDRLMDSTMKIDGFRQFPECHPQAVISRNFSPSTSPDDNATLSTTATARIYHSHEI